jgi:hypothetical protein
VAIGGDEAICIGFYLIDVCDGTGILLYGEWTDDFILALFVLYVALIVLTLGHCAHL